MTEQRPLDLERITAAIQPLFSSRPTSIEPASGGTYTSVYRIASSDQIFYLRLLPEAQEHFATEAAVHTQLRRLQIKVPEVIHFERYNEVLQQSFMITTEIKGVPLSQSDTLSQSELQTIMREAGKDLARINSLPVRGFGWMHELEATEPLSAPFSTHRAFALRNWDKHLNTLASTILSAPEVIMLEQVLRCYDSWLNIEDGSLVHGDFCELHIYQEHGTYTGLIDFGAIQGASRWYDLGFFHLRDGEHFSFRLEPSLVEGYGEVTALPTDYEQQIRFMSVLINTEILAEYLPEMSAQEKEQLLNVLRDDLVSLLETELL